MDELRAKLAKMIYPNVFNALEIQEQETNIWYIEYRRLLDDYNALRHHRDLLYDELHGDNNG